MTENKKAQQEIIDLRAAAIENENEGNWRLAEAKRQRRKAARLEKSLIAGPTPEHPIEGFTRCWCGSKYWDIDVCASCGQRYRPEDYDDQGELRR